MPHFVIIDRNVGLYQWGGEYEDKAAAFAAFDKEVGIDPHGVGLEEVATQFRTYQVTAEQLAAVERWWDSGSPASDWPLEGMRSL